MALITTPDKLKGFSLTTIDFEEYGALDGVNPYGNSSLNALGIGLANCHFSASADIDSNSRGVAVKVIQGPAPLSAGGFVRSAWIFFAKPQVAFGTFYRARDCRLIRIACIDPQLIKVASQDELAGAGDGYFGIQHSSPDIRVVRIDFEYASEAAAKASAIFLDDISYATTFLWRYRGVMEGLAWAFVILIGGIMITPVGPFCIACATPISTGMVRIIGLLTLALGAFGFASLRSSSSLSRTSRM